MTTPTNSADDELLQRRIENIVKHELSGDFDQAAGNATNSIMHYVTAHTTKAVERAKIEAKIEVLEDITLCDAEYQIKQLLPELKAQLEGEQS